MFTIESGSGIFLDKVLVVYIVAFALATFNRKFRTRMKKFTYLLLVLDWGKNKPFGITIHQIREKRAF
jgi:hypothetical protein